MWYLSALLCSILTALYLIFNQYMKMQPALLMVYRGVFLAILLSPFVFVISPVGNAAFYILAVIQGCLVAFMDNRCFAIAKQHGAEIVSSIQPLSLIIIFAVWLILNPTQIILFAENPYLMLGIVLSVLGITAAVLALATDTDTLSVFKKFWWLIPGVSAIDILNKQIMTECGTEVFAGLYYYTLVVSFVAGICNLLVVLKNKQNLKEIFRLPVLSKGIVIILIILLSMFSKNYAMYMSQNPAYVSSIILLAPVWVMFLNEIYLKNSDRQVIRLRKIPIMILLGSVMLLIILTGKM